MNRAIRALLVPLALAACADAPPAAPRDAAAPADRALDPFVAFPDVLNACPALRVEPAVLRVATGGAAAFRVGDLGERVVLFRALPGDGGAPNTVVTLGGNVVAGDLPGRLEVVAEDGACGQRVQLAVEVVGPLAVAPSFARVRPGAVVRFEVRGALGDPRWAEVSPVPASLGRLDPTTGTFTAGVAEGTARWLVRDDLGGQERAVSVTVSRDAALRTRAEFLLVPVGARVRVDVAEGSSEVDAALRPGGPGGALRRIDGALWFDAEGATPGTAMVSLTDRVTAQTVTVRVVVGERLRGSPVVRGEPYASGALAWGDFNADGRSDLAVAQPYTHGAVAMGGRLAVYLADASGALPAQASVSADGARRNDLAPRIVLSGDVNRDGVDDLVSASSDADLNRINLGAVEVRLGARGRGPSRDPDQVLFGTVDNARFGASVALSDVTGDERPELLVASPGARGPALHPGPCAPAGRLFVYLGTGDTPRPFSAAPWQTLELLAPDESGRCHDGEVLQPSPGMARFDVDGDGLDDLVVGVSATVASDRVGFGGRLLVYRSLGRAMGFEVRPSRVISLPDRTDVGRFAEGVERVETRAGPALMVRAPGFRRDPGSDALLPQTRGAVYAFARGFLPGVGSPAAPRFDTARLARARFVAGADEFFGASAASGDVDGDGDADYLVGGWFPYNPSPGTVWMFRGPSLAAALGGATLTAAWVQRGDAQETLGSAVAVDHGPGPARAVALGASARTTAVGVNTGAVDVLPAGPARDLPARWPERRAVALWQQAGDDAFGTGVAIGNRGTLFVGAPLASQRTDTTLRPRNGGVWSFPPGQTTADAALREPRENAQTGGAVALLDFNGDGRLDLAVGDPSASAGGWDLVRRGEVATPATDECFLRSPAGARLDASAPNRGVVRIYTQQPNGAWVLRTLALGREPEPERGLRGGFGGVLANAGDVNGDGRDDLAVIHAVALGGGAEVVLGRPDDAMGRAQVACGDPANAPWWPRRAVGGFNSAAGLGDLDRDGCADVAVGMNGDSQSGVSLRFGFGPRCADGHTSPFELGLVAEQRNLDDNRPGDLAARRNDDADRLPLSGFGSLVAAPGDVHGDGVPDLLVRVSSWALGDFTDPAVEVISGAWLAGICPQRRCPTGRTGALWVDGDYRRVSLQNLDTPVRTVIRSPEAYDPGFGASLGGVDLDGDGVSDVVVGSPGSSLVTPFAGAVLGWRGGPRGALRGDPWMVAVGDAGHDARFGASLALASGAWIAVGAPEARAQGPGTGEAFRWAVPR